MALIVSDVSTFFDPALCANNRQIVDGAVQICQKGANNVCGNCKLVQYCSKQCQLSDWKHHKISCKSAFMKDSWEPTWFRKGRQPAFIGGAPLVPFGAQKYLWGNMPALDILNSKNNEGEIKVIENDLALLFAASGDLRNVVTSLANLPETYEGECRVVLNDKEFIIVARNIIMLMTALLLDAKVAVPMIIHLWYSAILPRVMVDVLQFSLLPLIEDVCTKIRNRPDGSMQAKQFAFNGNKLRIVLKKEEWFNLAKFFIVPEAVTLEKSQMIRRRVTLAPERVDYRERAMLQWPCALREVDIHFRREGVLLPYGCSIAAFDTPNPTLFQDSDWPMKDSSNPREGWSYHKYMKHAPVAKADEHGAVFFYVRDLLNRFCTRLQKAKISFQMSCMDARDLGPYLQDMKFDRIEISNICDRGFLGPHSCVQIFSPLLKLRSDSPKAALLMLFLNAATETENANKGSDKWRSDLMRAARRLDKYMPLDRTELGHITNAGDPGFIRRTSCHDMFKDWEHWFDCFLKDSEFATFAHIHGLKIRKKHAIVEPWPYKIGVRTTKKEFDILRAGSVTGYERYIELERQHNEDEG
ncbi:hypothetical protein BU25DRAFT_349343 [Macroventuria anomochaeta]|uniref:Uncharacterized protein n=1 Tax=Macroventuria anomochaeta TaxID=301207 RepID=A0ACB6RR93_9PLEO|nr:uncharacterized protein BU25DRAFT_349343 [Macroventuria anomochaeta]KAF2623920.1 hypothetical protein BU25DRAFT_349343 [Macroventuria anomochaeta]